MMNMMVFSQNYMFPERYLSIKDALGEIQCFGLTPQNKTRYKFDEEVIWDDSCKLGQESCTFITQNDGKKR